MSLGKPIEHVDALPGRSAPALTPAPSQALAASDQTPRSFKDSNGDGMGDFQGLIEKLDYIASLGVTAVWILPFYPSPLRDDGYDISDYFNVNPDYGTLKEFKEFLKEAHQRGIRVITELVLNHTSDQHAWFQRARKSEPGS